MPRYFKNAPKCIEEHVTVTTFWQFSIDFYGKPKNQTLLLHLQDEFALNVNLLLFVMYLAIHHTEMNMNEIAQIVKDLDNLDSLINKLRTKRRLIKKNAVATFSQQEEQVYKDLLKQELAVEKQQQHLIVHKFLSLVSLYSSNVTVTEDVESDRTIAKTLEENNEPQLQNIDTYKSLNCSVRAMLSTTQSIEPTQIRIYLDPLIHNFNTYRLQDGEEV